MNTSRLREILKATTGQYRKGPQIVTEPATQEMPVTVTHVYAVPHEDDATNLELVDCHFIKVGVDKAEAEKHRDELIAILREWPDPEQLAGGPSYITAGGTIGDQGAAFQLFALGKVLGLWNVITPESMGFEGAEASQMAGAGFVMCTGFRP